MFLLINSVIYMTRKSQLYISIRYFAWIIQERSAPKQNRYTQIQENDDHPKLNNVFRMGVTVVNTCSEYILACSIAVHTPCDGGPKCINTYIILTTIRQPS